MKKHYQHTKKYLKELNSTTNVKNEVQAFRTFDEIWLIGKYKGLELNKTPPSYIGWVLENVKLSSTLKAILRSKLK
jgi:hypothetical protein